MHVQKVRRAMTQMPALAMRTLLAAVLVALISACAREDECTGGEFRCDGDVAMNCANFAGRKHDYNVWSAAPCGAGKCKLDTGTNAAFCALETTPEPQCDEQRSGFCDGTTLSSCRAGYVVASKDCASSEQDPQVCVSPGHAPIGGKSAPNAMCASTPEPSPLCASGSLDSSDSCDGSEVVLCRRGYEIGRIACGPGLSCRGFGVCTKEDARAAPPTKSRFDSAAPLISGIGS